MNKRVDARSKGRIQRGKAEGGGIGASSSCEVVINTQPALCVVLKAQRVESEEERVRAI